MLGTNLAETSKGPNAEEFSFLLEKQDAMLESLTAEIKICSDEVERLSRENKDNLTELQVAKTTISTLNDKLAQLTQAFEDEKKNNTQLKQQISDMNNDASLFNSAEKLLDLEAKLREMQFNLERERRISEMANKEVAEERNIRAQLRSDLEASWQNRKQIVENLNDRIESLSKELAEKTVACQSQTMKLDDVVAQLLAKTEVLTQREAFFENFSKQLGTESAALKKECAVLRSRVSALTEENLILRTKVLKKSAFPAEISELEDVKGLQKLITDQAHLIATLREECSLITEKYARERTTHRQQLKAAKKESRNLEARIEKLLFVSPNTVLQQ